MATARYNILLSQIETAIFVASYGSQGYGGGIRLRPHAEQSRAEQ
jgi:hypothetical protein